MPANIDYLCMFIVNGDALLKSVIKVIEIEHTRDKPFNGVFSNIQKGRKTNWKNVCVFWDPRRDNIAK